MWVELGEDDGGEIGEDSKPMLQPFGMERKGC